MFSFEDTIETFLKKLSIAFDFLFEFEKMFSNLDMCVVDHALKYYLLCKELN